MTKPVCKMPLTTDTETSHSSATERGALSRDFTRDIWPSLTVGQYSLVTCLYSSHRNRRTALVLLYFRNSAALRLFTWVVMSELLRLLHLLSLLYLFSLSSLFLSCSSICFKVHLYCFFLVIIITIFQTFFIASVAYVT